MRFIKYFDAGIDESMVRSFCGKYNLSERVVKIIIGRGYSTDSDVEDFLHPENVKLQSPFSMKGIKEAVEKIKLAIASGKKILIFGDYDVDGISATAIMVKTLEKMGASAKYFLPNRYVDGYGLTKDVILKIKKLYSPDLIITVDCGITAVDEVEYAKSLGIDIIITDHHEIGDTLPNTIVINTKFEDQEYSFRGLCGTGVAFKLSEALTSFKEASEYLPIVAIATIADIVPLTKENRTLVRLGFKNMEKLPIGLKHMFSANKVSLKNPDATDIAFKIAPKLNASGRMGDAVDSLMLYFETNPNKTKAQIEKIIAHNTKRQNLGAKINEDCKKMLYPQDTSNMPAIILWKEDWDQGILGIECSKILEDYNRPVFLFTKEGEYLKGSARSVKDINIHNILTSVSDILEVFGGHTMAAGLTLKLKNFDEFKRRVNAYILEHINPKVFEPIQYYDDEINLNDIDQKFIDDLGVLEPCGCDNPKPKFKIDYNDITIQPLSKNSDHANIIFGKKLNLVFFNYTKNINKLNFGTGLKFIFEFQETKGKYFKGIIKEFEFDGIVKPTTAGCLDCNVVYQLADGDYNNAEYKTYKQSEIVKFLLDASRSVFGTLFVANSLKTYNSFIEKYDMGNIYSYDIINHNNAGYNSLLLAPKNVDFARKYSKIIFLDSVIDLSFVAKINDESKAQVLLPIQSVYSKEVFDKLDLSRQHFAFVYQKMLSIDNTKFTDIYSIYTHLFQKDSKRVSFNNFIVPFSVFNELKIISFDEKNDLLFKINKNVKTELNTSKIYNKINLLKKTII